MCKHYVRVTDLRHPKVYNMFACGRCPACLFSASLKRKNKIKNHYPQGFIPYFVTLTYDNKYIPYIDLRDFIKLRNSFICDDVSNKTSQQNFLPIYRDFTNVSSVRRSKSSSEVSHEDKRLSLPIGYIEFTEDFLAYDYSTLSGIVLDAKTREIDPFRISVSFMQDFQAFIARFRQRLFRTYKKRITLSYFFCPEYGPTTQRFHMHLLLWLPKFITLADAEHFLRKTWTFCNYDALKSDSKQRYIEVAYNAARYVSQYVNCSSDVSKLLLAIAPLKVSHSLSFGFSSTDYQLSSLLDEYKKNRDCRYLRGYFDSNGVYKQSRVFYPKHVLYRYFPTVKGFNRSARSTLLDAYKDPEKYFALSSVPCGETEKGDFLFMSSIKDVYGYPITMTKSYARYFVKRLRSVYELYYKPLNFSYYGYVEFVIDYLINRSLSLYKCSFESLGDFRYAFYNFKQIGLVGSSFDITDMPNYIEDFPEIISMNTSYIEQFNDNIKIRKLNSYGKY